MKLLRLYITGFGRLRERVIEFGPGLTLLHGPNEAGKSTVLACLAQVLFGKPSQRSLFPDFTPWDGGPCAAALEFADGDERYRLTRRFSESGARAQALHRLHDEGAETLVTQEAGEIRKRVAAWFGTSDDRIFYRVFSLTQADFTPLDNYDGLREHLERVMSGAEMAVTAAVQRLDAHLAALRRGVGQPALPQNWGALKRASDARTDWESRLLDAKRQQRRLAEQRAALQQVQTDIAGHTARLALIPAVLEQDRRRRELVERVQGMKSSWAGVEEERERITRLQDDRVRLQQALDSAPSAYADPGALRNRIAAMQHAAGMPAVIGWAAMAVGIAVGTAAFLHTQSPLALLTPLLGVAAGLPIVLRAARRTGGLARLCAECETSSLPEVTERLDAVERQRRELDAITLALTTVSEAAHLTERSRAQMLEITAAEQELSTIPGTPLSAEEAYRLAMEQRQLEEGLPALQERERPLMREVAVLEQAERDLIDLEDGVAYWRREEARAKDEAEALALARTLLSEAGQQAHTAIADPLAARISPLFAAMTGGRYPRVMVSGDAGTLAAHPLDATGAPIPPDQLSKGAYDQFILAVRLALGQTIAGEDGSPIFLLDDPLLHFDGDRRREAFTLLRQLAERTQIILATHDERLPGEVPGAAVVLLGSAVNDRQPSPAQ